MLPRVPKLQAILPENGKPLRMTKLLTSISVKKVAIFFDSSIYFGTVVERVRGPIVAAIANRTRKLQAVWKIAYDDTTTRTHNNSQG